MFSIDDFYFETSLSRGNGRHPWEETFSIRGDDFSQLYRKACHALSTTSPCQASNLSPFLTATPRHTRRLQHTHYQHTVSRQPLPHFRREGCSRCCLNMRQSFSSLLFLVLALSTSGAATWDYDLQSNFDLRHNSNDTLRIYWRFHNCRCRS